MHHDTALLATIAVGLGLAFGMARYALRGLGLGAEQAEMSVQEMRMIPATAHSTPPRPEPVG